MNPKPTETLRLQPKTVRLAFWLISFLLMFPLVVMVLSPVVVWLGKILLMGLLFLVFVSLYLYALVGNWVGFL